MVICPLDEALTVLQRCIIREPALKCFGLSVIRIKQSFVVIIKSFTDSSSSSKSRTIGRPIDLAAERQCEQDAQRRHMHPLQEPKTRPGAGGRDDDDRTAIQGIRLPTNPQLWFSTMLEFKFLFSSWHALDQEQYNTHEDRWMWSGAHIIRLVFTIYFMSHEIKCL
jgi:hypothetical protein